MVFDALNAKLEKLIGLVKQLDAPFGGGGSSGGVMSGSLANISTPPSTTGQKMGAAGSGIIGYNPAEGIPILGAVGRYAGNMASGAFQMAGGMMDMMPSVDVVMKQATDLYMAQVMSGGLMSNKQLTNLIQTSLGDFTTSPGAGERAAAGLVGMGYAPNDPRFKQIMNETASASRYLGLSTEAGAQAFAGLTTGRMSSNLMSRYGIFTSDLSGNPLSSTDIFKQLESRLTAGRGYASPEDVLADLRSGFLGPELAASGLDETQQGLFVQYLIDKSKGINLDYDNPNSIAQAEARNKELGIENPLLAPMEAASAESRLMSAAQESYIEGLKASTDALVSFKDALTNIVPFVGGPKAAIETLLSDYSVQGAIEYGKGFFKMLTAGPQLALDLIKDLGGDIGGPSAAASGTVVTTSPSSFSASSIHRSGSGGSMGLGVPHAQGGDTGGTVQTQNRTSNASSSSNQANATGGPKSFKLLKPVNAKITARYMQKYSSYDPNKVVWPDGHKGVDFAAAEGTPVVAAADGVARTASGGQLGNYVEIEHDNGKFTYYAHLSGFASGISGKRVTKGTLVGYVGSTGRSSGPHLHFCLSRKKGTENHEDPSPYWESSPGYAYPENTGGNAAGDTAAPDRSSGASQAAPDLQSTSNAITGQAGADNPAFQPSSSVVTALVSESRSAVSVTSYQAGGSAIKPPSSYKASNWYAGGTGRNPNASEGGEFAQVEPLREGSVSKFTRNSGPNSFGSSSTTVSKDARTNNVTINVSVQSASESEARKFAKMVKDILEDDDRLARMGGR